MPEGIGMEEKWQRTRIHRIKLLIAETATRMVMEADRTSPQIRAQTRHPMEPVPTVQVPTAQALTAQAPIINLCHKSETTA